jgi:hypothetical protein
LFFTKSYILMHRPFASNLLPIGREGLEKPFPESF